MPFCVAGGYLAWRNLTDEEPRLGARPRLDTVGMLLLSPGIAALVYGLTQLAGTNGLTSPASGLPLIGGLVLLVGYVVRALRRGSEALLDIRLLRHRAVASSSALIFLTGGALYGSMLLLPLYWQQVRGEDALGAALLLIPQGVGTLLSRTLAGRYMDRFGSRPVALVAFAVTLAATVPFGSVTASTSNIWLMAVLFLRGIGLGAAMIAIMGAGFVGVRREEIPAASSISRVAQQVGGSVGVAVLVVVLQRASAGARTPAGLASGFGHAFWWSAALTAAAIPLCHLLPGRPGAESPVNAGVPEGELTEV